MNIAILAAADLGNMVQKTGETFGFDTKIFLSQVVSFVIVALVLRQFAYKPILAVLEERRQRIAEGLLNAEKIKQQLAEAEQRHAEILAKANAQAQKMIDDARESAAHVGERKQQEAIVAAEQISRCAISSSRSVSTSFSTSPSASDTGTFTISVRRQALHTDGPALGAQAPALADGARLQRAIRLERFLIGPGTFFETAAQIGHGALEVRAERILRGFSLRVDRRPGAPKQHDVPKLLRQLAERHLRIDRERLLQAREHVVDEAAIALGPRHDRSGGERQAVVRHDARRDRSRRPRRAPGTPDTPRAAS